MAAACRTCAGGCAVEVRAAYARRCLSALRRDETYPECEDYRDRYWRGERRA